MLRQYEEIELETFAAKQERKRKIAQNYQLRAGASVVENLGLATIYTMFLHPLLKSFLETLGRYILFPVLIVASLTQAILAWRQASLDKWKSRSILHAVVETVTAVTLTSAVIGTLAFAATFTIITPLIFVAVGAGNAIYKGGAAIYNDVKSVRAKTEEAKNKYHARAIQHGIGAVASLIGAAVTASVFLLGKTVIAAVGIALGLFAVGMGIYNGVKAHQAQQALEQSPEPLLDEDHQPKPKQKPANTLGIVNALNPSKAQDILSSPTPTENQDHARRSLIAENTTRDDELTHAQKELAPRFRLSSSY